MGFSSSNDGGGIFASILASLDSDPSKQRVLFGSNHLKHGRSSAPDEHEWRSLTVGRTNSHFLFPDGEQMLSFSSNAAASPYYHHLSSPSYARNPDLVYGIPNGSMHGFLGGSRGPFTRNGVFPSDKLARLNKNTSELCVICKLEVETDVVQLENHICMLVMVQRDDDS